MTILIPTDFSKLAKVAVLYAVQIAKKIKADVILFTVISVHTSAATAINWKKLETEMANIALQDAEQLIKEIREEVKGPVDISYNYSIGYPIEDIIETFAIDKDVDLIVMGTKGATGLKGNILGSKTAAVINKSSRPVISVPGENEFKQVKKIVYATDMKNIIEELKILATYAGLLGASIHVLHVIPSYSTRKIDTEKKVARLIKQVKYSDIHFHVSKNDHLIKAVDEFVIDHKADMLAMFTHTLDFYEKLLGKSVTQQLAFHSHVPLLTFNKNTILRN